MAEGFGYTIDISSLDKEIVKVEKKLKRLEETSLRVAINMDDAFRQVANGGVKALGDSLSVINKSLREIGSKRGGIIANLGRGSSSTVDNINAIATALENINRSKPSNGGFFASLSKINMDIIEAKSRFKELQKEFTHLSSPAGDKSAHTAIQQEVQFIMEYISALKKQKQEIIDTQKEIQKAKQRTTQEDPFAKKIAGYNGETLEVKRYKDAMKAMKEFYAEQEKEAQKASKELSQRLKRENQTYGGSLQYSASAKTINEQIIAIRNLEAARDNLSKTDSRYKSKLKTLNDEIAKNKREIEEARGGVERLRESHSRLSNTARQLKNAFTLLFSVSQITGYIKKLVEVRGEFELQERTLQVLLQSQDKATQLWNQVVDLAVKSPFRVKELVTYTKQLAAYRVESDKLFDTTKRLADISAGLGVDMQRLILAFGQVKAANFLRGTELRQFTEAGIPMLEELAKYFTQLEGRAVSVGKVFERVSKRMVSFADVEAVLKKMTDAGGVFYNMQEQQAETLKGQMSNLRDSIDIMLNEIGEKQDGVIKGSVAVARTLVENWETLAVILKGLVHAFALYKLNAILASDKTIEWARSLRVANVQVGKSLSINQLLSASITQLRLAIRGLGREMKALWVNNPWAVIITAIVAAVARFVRVLNEHKKAIDDINKSFEQLKKSTRDISIDFTYASNKGDLDTARIELQKLIDLANREYNMDIKVNLEELTQDELNDYFVKLRAQIEQAQAFAQSFVTEVQKMTQWTSSSDIVENANLFGERMVRRANFIKEASQKAVDALNREKEVTGELSKEQQMSLDLMSEPRKINESELDYINRLELGYSKLRGSIKGAEEERLKLTRYSQPAYGSDEYYRLQELNKEIEEFYKKYLTLEKKDVSSTLLGVTKENLGKQIKELFKNIYISDSLTDEQKTLQLKLAIDKAQTQFGWNQFVRDYVEDMVEKQFGVKFAKQEKGAESLEDWAERVKNAVDEINQKIKEVNPEIEDMNLFPTPKVGQTKEAYLALAKEVIKIGRQTYSEIQVIEDEAQVEQTKALSPFVDTFEKILNLYNSKDIDVFSPKLRVIKEIYEEYKKLKETFDDITAKEGAMAKFGDAFKEAFGKTPEEMGFDLFSEEGVKKAYDYLIKEASDAKKKIQTELSKGEIVWDVNIQKKKDADKELADSIQKMLDRYDFTVEMKKLNIPLDLAEKIFKVKTIDLSSIRAEVQAELTKATELKGQEGRIKQLQDFLKTIDTLEIKQQEEAAKRFVDLLTKTLDETKVILERKGVNISLAKKYFDEGDIDAATFVEMVKNITEQTNREIGKVNFQKFKESSEYIQAMGDMSLYSKRELEDLRRRLQDVITTSKGIFSTEEVKDYQQALAKLDDAIDDLEKSPFRWESFAKVKDILDVEEDIQTQKNKKEKAEKDILDKQKKQVEIEKELKRLQEDRLVILEKIKEAEKGGQDTTSLQKNLANVDVQIANKTTNLSTITNEIGSLGQTSSEASSMLDVLGGKLKSLGGGSGAASPVAIIDAVINGINDTVQGVLELTNEIGSVMESFGKETDMSTGFGKFQKGFAIFAESSQHAADGWNALKSGDPVGAVVSVVKSVTSIIKGINEYKDAINETQIQDHLEEIERLEREYEKLGWVVERALSIEKYGMVAKQTKNLGQQINNTSKAIALEEGKKNTDEERIKELKEQAEDAERQIQELYDNLREDIVGTYEDLSSTLADAMIEALRNGEDALKAWGDTVDEIIGDIVKKLAVQKYVEPAVSKALDQFYNKVMPKNAAAEQAFQKMQSYAKGSKEYDEAYEKYLKLNEKALGEIPIITEDSINELKQYLEMVGVGFELIAEMIAGLYEGTNMDGLTALQKGISGITEDQAEVLTSYWNSVRGYTASIDAKMDAIIANMTMSAEDNPMLNELRGQTQYLRDIYNFLTSVTTSDNRFNGKAFKVTM